jgi:hypothetical protein
MEEEVHPNKAAPHYARSVAIRITPDNNSYNPSEVAEDLCKLRIWLDKVEVSNKLTAGDTYLKYVKQHVSNLVAAMSNGIPPGAPELWTLSAAIDYLCDHLSFIEKSK